MINQEIDFTPQSKTVDIFHCARCGEDHKQLEFKRFSKYPVRDNDHTEWGMWALCPTVQEPILMRALTVDEK